jgi:hypothetical protein
MAGEFYRSLEIKIYVIFEEIVRLLERKTVPQV